MPVVAKWLGGHSAPADHVQHVANVAFHRTAAQKGGFGELSAPLLEHESEGTQPCKVSAPAAGLQSAERSAGRFSAPGSSLAVRP